MANPPDDLDPTERGVELAEVLRQWADGSCYLEASVEVRSRAAGGHWLSRNDLGCR